MHVNINFTPITVLEHREPIPALEQFIKDKNGAEFSVAGGLDLMLRRYFNRGKVCVIVDSHVVCSFGAAIEYILLNYKIEFETVVD